MNWLFVITFIIALVVIIELIWLLVPYLFHIIGAPKLDGSYKYSKIDFESDGKTPKNTLLSIQENDFRFEFDQTLSEYRIKFGESRNLTKGKIRLLTEGVWYSSNPERDEKRIFVKNITETKKETNAFRGLSGDFKRITVEWTLEENPVRLITHFDMYNNCTLKVEESDLHNTEVVIEDLNFILFTLEFPDGLASCSTGDFNTLSVNFPCFNNESSNQRMLTFKNSMFSPPSRSATVTDAPRIFFDNDCNTFTLSSADEFLIHLSSVNDSHIACGLNGEIENIENNYCSHYLLLFDRGINSSCQNLGDLLRSFHGKKRKSMYMDMATSYIGYWTDNGSYYYYNPIKGKKLSETLLEVKKHIKEIDLPIQYYDLDSWWYIKSVSSAKRKLLGNFGRIVGGGLYGGAIKYEIDPYYMHVDVDVLSRILEKPLVAHHRWIDSETPYKRKFNFYTEKNKLNFWARLIRGYDDKSICLDKDFWGMIMSNCEKRNIAIYEQDWMDGQFSAFKILRNQTGNADKWLLNMGCAAADYNRTIQYCMATPGMFLTSLKVDAVSHARTAQDYHPRWPRSYDYKSFVQSNIFASALRLWPFKDVFRSTCEGPVKGEKMPEFMALVSTLSCGPVGVGDKIGNFGKDVIMRACRKDGLILKPDRPLTATDRMFVPHSKYFLSTTSSEINGKKWDYILINKLDIRQPKDSTITKEDIGTTEDKVAFNYFKNEFHILDDKTPFNDRLKGMGYNYWIVAPFLKKGFAIIGDISKYTTMSFKEFLSVDIKDSQVDIKIENIAGETVKLLMYDQEKIQSIDVDGKKIERTEADILNNDFIPDEKAAWCYDQKMNASLLNLRFSQDGVKRISILL